MRKTQQQHSIRVIMKSEVDSFLDINTIRSDCLLFTRCRSDCLFFCNHNLRWPVTWIGLHNKQTDALSNLCFYWESAKIFWGHILYQSKTQMVPNFRSNGPIKLIFEMNLSYSIIKHPHKFHQNRSRTFESIDIKMADTQTDRQTHTRG